MLSKTLSGFLLALLVPVSVIADEVYVCEHPDGHLSVTHWVIDDPQKQEEALQRLRRDQFLPNETWCWRSDDTTLPLRDRPDPNDSASTLSQRHRWRKGQNGTVVIDPTVMRPDHTRTIQQISRDLPPARRAAILATPLGDNLFRAIRDGDWALAKALMAQIRSKVGQPDEVMTLPEINRLRKVARDYEANLD